MLKIADIDFRKSRTSFIDDSLLIDAGGGASLIPLFHHHNPNLRLRSVTPNFPSGAQISLMPGQILISNATNRDANFILRSRSPAAVGRLRSLTPSSQRQDNEYLASNSLRFNDYHSSLTSLSNSKVNRCQNEVRTVSVTPMMSRQAVIINQAPAVGFKQSNRSFVDEVTDEYDTDIGDGNEYARVRTQYKSDRTRTTPLANPKMFANHLVWNQSSRSAECIDNYETIKSSLVAPSNQKIHAVARVLSPGGFKCLVLSFMYSSPEFITTPRPKMFGPKSIYGMIRGLNQIWIKNKNRK